MSATTTCCPSSANANFSSNSIARVLEFDAFKNLKHFTLLDLHTNEQQHITIASNANLWCSAISNNNARAVSLGVFKLRHSHFLLCSFPCTATDLRLWKGVFPMQLRVLNVATNNISMYIIQCKLFIGPEPDVDALL